MEVGQNAGMKILPDLGFDLRANFAARLKRWRLDRKLPLKHVAEDLDCAMSTFSNWEHGKHLPRKLALGRIARYTGLRPCQLFCPHADSCKLRDCPYVPQQR